MFGAWVPAVGCISRPYCSRDLLKRLGRRNSEKIASKQVIFVPAQPADNSLKILLNAPILFISDSDRRTEVLDDKKIVLLG